MHRLMASSRPCSVSVVVPSFNTAELTLRCLDSVAATCSTDDEIIVVDDGSSDDTVARIAHLPFEVTVLQHDHSRGFTAAANSGIREARGDLVLLLNSDTEVPAEGLDPMLRAFAEDDRLGIAGAQLSFPDGSPQWSGGRQPTMLWLFALASGLPGVLAHLPGYRRLKPLAGAPHRVDWVTGAALAVRRSVLADIGVLDERFRFYCQDLDLCLRARAHGWKVRLLPAFRVLHHHGASLGVSEHEVVQSQSPQLLWPDLVQWAAQHHGHGWAHRAATLMRLGVGLRLVGRFLVALVLSPSRRRSWVQQSRTLATAREKLKMNLDHQDFRGM